ncbi:Phosphatidylglycerol/phosphatidylinositol transfer protein [Nakaseomyces glabratus]|nr:Phosphatidylglycerol/phosphatidylinositol transfer protein [Nakaseomyces glabratus]SLM12061.1 Phosphatidylglycerol/phosphatidylinositol transfer protein [Nakaseomyces glabratus]
MQVKSLISSVALWGCAFTVANPIIGWGIGDVDKKAPMPPGFGETKPIPGDSPLKISGSKPTKRGSKLVIKASGEIFETIEEGAYVDVEVRLGYIKLLTQTYDLCEILEDNDVDGLTCPIKKGKYDNLSKDVDIPQEVPPGKYLVTARAYTNDDDLITCITGEVYFPPPGI